MRVLRSQYQKSETFPMERSVSRCDTIKENIKMGFGKIINLESNPLNSQPMPVEQTQAVDNLTENYKSLCNNMKIKLFNVPQNLGRINVVIQIYDEGTKWYTNLYKSYENDIWNRVPRYRPSRKCKWYFDCRFCDHRMGSFTTLKAHLNHHFGFYPNRCRECPRKYTSRSSLWRHHKKNHVVASAYKPPQNTQETPN